MIIPILQNVGNATEIKLPRIRQQKQQYSNVELKRGVVHCNLKNQEILFAALVESSILSVT